MVGWHDRLNGHGFEWTLGVGDGQGGLACCGSWGHKESDTTEWLNWTELNTQAKAPILWPPDGREEPTHWKRSWCWERVRAREEEGSRGWDGWMASPTQWTWIWVTSGIWWRTGQPGVLESIAGVHGVAKNWTQLINWTTTTIHILLTVVLTDSESVSLTWCQCPHPPVNAAPGKNDTWGQERTAGNTQVCCSPWHSWYRVGPVGLLGTKPFCVFHFFAHRK